MGGRHHHLFGREAERGAAQPVGVRLRLVGPRNLRAQDRIPGQPGMAGHVHHERDIAVGAGADDVFAPEPRKAEHRVRPRVEAVPGAVEAVLLRFGQARHAELLQQGLQVLPVQHVEDGVGPRPAADFLHRGLVAVPPAPRETVPVELVAFRRQRLLGLPRHRTPPVHHRAEYIEQKRLHHRRSSPPQPRRQTASAPPRPQARAVPAAGEMR